MTLIVGCVDCPAPESTPIEIEEGIDARFAAVAQDALLSFADASRVPVCLRHIELKVEVQTPGGHDLAGQYHRRVIEAKPEHLPGVMFHELCHHVDHQSGDPSLDVPMAGDASEYDLDVYPTDRDRRSEQFARTCEAWLLSGLTCGDGADDWFVLPQAPDLPTLSPEVGWDLPVLVRHQWTAAGETVAWSIGMHEVFRLDDDGELRFETPVQRFDLQTGEQLNQLVDVSLGTWPSWAISEGGVLLVANNQEVTALHPDGGWQTTSVDRPVLSVHWLDAHTGIVVYTDGAPDLWLDDMLQPSGLAPIPTTVDRSTVVDGELWAVRDLPESVELGPWDGAVELTLSGSFWGMHAGGFVTRLARRLFVHDRTGTPVAQSPCDLNTSLVRPGGDIVRVEELPDRVEVLRYR